MRRRALFLAVLPVTLAGCSSSSSSSPSPSPSPTRPSGAVDAVVYLAAEVTPAQKAAVQRTLQADHGVLSVQFESSEESYRRYKQNAKGDPGWENLRPETFPDTFRFRATDRAAADTVLATVRTMPGVDRATLAPTPRPS